MRSILENLFSGFLEGKKVSNDSADIDSKKNILSSESDNFSADLNMFLVGEKQDLEKSIKQVNEELNNENPNIKINSTFIYISRKSRSKFLNKLLQHIY